MTYFLRTDLSDFFRRSTGQGVHGGSPAPGPPPQDATSLLFGADGWFEWEDLANEYSQFVRVQRCQGPSCSDSSHDLLAIESWLRAHPHRTSMSQARTRYWRYEHVATPPLQLHDVRIKIVASACRFTTKGCQQHTHTRRSARLISKQHSCSRAMNAWRI